MESRKEYQKKWRAANPDKCKLYTTTYKVKHMHSAKVASKKWKADHPEEAKESRKRSYEKYREKSRTADKKRYKQYRADWIEWLSLHNLVSCSECGYDKCFAAIDYHHTNPAEKDKGVAFILCRPITEDGISEIRKTIPLCRNCHAELHSMGRTA
jgi:hypothetical protein